MSDQLKPTERKRLNAAENRLRRLRELLESYKDDHDSTDLYSAVYEAVHGVNTEAVSQTGLSGSDAGQELKEEIINLADAPATEALDIVWVAPKTKKQDKDNA